MTARHFVILYVEDNDFIRESFTELLDAPARRIVGVANGAAARAALAEQAVNLLITDINLPDGSGLEIAREALGQNHSLPVIICSGHDLREAAASLGPTAVAMTKPVDPDEVDAMIARLEQQRPDEAS